METKRSHMWIYAAIAAAIAVLMVAGAAVHLQRKETAEARAKAKLLVAALKAEGIPPLTEDEAVAMFGTDGGPMAEFNGTPEARALLGLQLANNGPGQRPVVLTRKFLLAEETVLAIYRPETLPEFKAWVDAKYGEIN